MEFSTSEEASKALAAKNGAEIDGRAIRLDFSTPRQRIDPKERAAKLGDKRSAPSDTVFIANLDFDVDESILSAEAEKFGTILSLRLPTDRFEYPLSLHILIWKSSTYFTLHRDSGERKGFGYVTYESVAEAERAVDGLAGHVIGGRAIRTDFSVPRENGGGGRGGFGGGRGGRDGFRGGRGDGFRGGGDGGRGGGRGRGGFGGRGRGNFFQGQKKKFD